MRNILHDIQHRTVPDILHGKESAECEDYYFYNTLNFTIQYISLMLKKHILIAIKELCRRALFRLYVDGVFFNLDSI